MEELKPCPFCGSTARLCHTNDNHNSPFVECDGAIQVNGTKSCFACQYPWNFKTDEEAVAAWNRRAEPENKALTNFDRITQSPEELAKFLQGIWDGKIPFDNLYCDECGNCLEGGGCKENTDETNCITRWLNQTK